VAFFFEGRRLKPVTAMRQPVSIRGLLFKFLSETQKSRDAIEYRVRLYLSKVSKFSLEHQYLPGTTPANQAMS
jgi:hypothetical protein